MCSGAQPAIMSGTRRVSTMRPAGSFAAGDAIDRVVLDADDRQRRRIVLTGGGAMLSNIDMVLRQATGLPVSIAEDPLLCVALGTGHAVENIDRLRGVLSTMY